MYSDPVIVSTQLPLTNGLAAWRAGDGHAFEAVIDAVRVR
jgi:hypothetical protein